MNRSDYVPTDHGPGHCPRCESRTSTIPRALAMSPDEDGLEVCYECGWSCDAEMRKEEWERRDAR